MATVVIKNESVSLLWELNTIFMLILPKIVYCIEHEHGMATLSRGCKPRTETRSKGGPAEQFLKYGGRWPPLLKWRWWGGGANLAVLSFWLFRTFRLLNLSWVIVERSHVDKFQSPEKYLLLLCLIAYAGSTTRSLQIKILHCRFL